jgi:hypothetical protein
MTSNAATVALAAAAIFVSAAAQSAPRHPPTFKDLQEMDRLDIENPKDMDKMMALIEATKFTSEELQKIRNSGDVRLLVGAGAKIGRDNSLERELLLLAAARAPDDPVPPAALAYRQVSEWSTVNTKESEILDNLKRWRQLEPENSVPWYLEAALYARQDKFDDAARALAEASGYPKFNSHCATLRRYTVAAAEFVGYPKYTARYHALGYAGEMEFSLLGRQCLAWAGANEQVAKDCLLLGKRLEAESALFIGELIGFSVQKQALKKLPQEATEAELKRIEDRRKYIAETCERLRSLEKIAPEKRQVAYLDDAFATSEAKAIEKLAAEYPGGAK